MFFKNKEVKAATTQLVGLHTRISERNLELKEIEGKIAAKEAEVEALSTHLNVLNSLGAANDAKQKVEAEIEAQKKELDNIMAILREFYGVQDAITTKNSLESEIASLKEQIGSLKIELGAYKSLKGIMEEVASLERRKKLLEAHPNRRFKSRDVIIASYYPNINDDENYASNLMPFIYQRPVSYLYDDEEHMAAEYASIGGARWAAVAEDGKYLVESKRRSYNTGINEYVTLEDVCTAIGSNLYLEEYVTLDDIKLLVSLLESYYFGKDNDYSLRDVLDLLRKAEARIRKKKNIDIPV